MAEYKTIRYERDGDVLKITTNRPHVLNAQSRLLLEELDEAFERGGSDSSVKVIVLAGEGKHFSAGHDLGSDEELAERKERGYPETWPELYERSNKLYVRYTMRWRDVPKPTIAQVQGYCIMGGMMIAQACDLIVAADDARFAERSVRFGLASVQYAGLPYEIGVRKAKEHLWTGEFISAAEALRLGLVNRVVPRGRLEEETMALAKRIALNDGFALRMSKMSINAAQDAMGFGNHIRSAFQAHWVTSQVLGMQSKRRPYRETIAEQSDRFGDQRS